MTRRIGLIASAAASLLLIAGALSSRGAERRLCPRSLVPAYVVPNELVRLAQLPQLLVINPASGPGTTPDPEYKRAIAAAETGGSRVLGYVPTGWGTRPKDAVEADINHYRDWYGVEGVFLDEAATAESALPYYRALRDRADFVVLNPGVVPARGYFDIADVVVTFEGPFSAYENRKPDPVPERSAHLVYDTPRDQAVRPSEQSVGYVYFTSGTLPHPWGTFPDYLASELDALGGCR